MPDSWENMEARARPRSHRRPHRHRGQRKKGCTAAALVILAATAAGWLLGMVVFTAIIALL